MSKLNVVGYIGGIPAKNKNPEKPLILKNFIQGVQSCGDSGLIHDGMHLPTDVGVIQGWVHEESPNAPHLLIRRRVIEGQKKLGKKVITADSNLFLYADPTNPHHYLRYSFDGVFPQTGNYCDDIVDPTRWQQISKDIGISLKPWRTTGDHILVCLQRNGGWSMQGVNNQEWAVNTVKELRKYTDRKIVLRTHPGDGKARFYLNKNNKDYKLQEIDNDVEISLNIKSFLEDLKNAHAVVVHNSSPAIGASIEGVPVFLTDPISSQAREVANTDLSQIESPKEFDRQTWVERISMFHWNFEDLKSGKCWRHMRNYV